MAKITNGHSFGITGKQAIACRLMAEGKTLDEIAPICFNLCDEHLMTDPAKLRKAKATLRRWQHDPRYAECYRAIIREIAMPEYGKALRKVSDQMDHSNAWLANKAANDVLTRFGPAIMGEEDRQIIVKVEGMPELGVPPTDDE